MVAGLRTISAEDNSVVVEASVVSICVVIAAEAVVGAAGVGVAVVTVQQWQQQSVGISGRSGSYWYVIDVEVVVHVLIRSSNSRRSINSTRGCCRW